MYEWATVEVGHSILVIHPIQFFLIKIDMDFYSLYITLGRKAN